MKKRKFLDLAYVADKLSCRKGMGIELAVLVMLVVLGSSILLVSSAMYGQNNLTKQEQELLDRIALDNIADSIISGNTVDSAETVYENYVAFQKDGDKLVAVMNGDDADAPKDLDEDVFIVITDNYGNLLLTVEQKDGIITKWIYH